MKAIGKNINGEEVEFKIDNNYVFCSNNQLTELHIPNGVENVYCSNNKLTELNLPNGVEKVYCYNNELTELKIPNGVEVVDCYNNPIKEITLPKTIKYAELPLNCIVLNIDEFKNNDKVLLHYQVNLIQLIDY